MNACTLFHNRLNPNPQWANVAWPNTFVTFRVARPPSLGWGELQAAKDALVGAADVRAAKLRIKAAKEDVLNSKDGPSWSPAYWAPGYTRGEQGIACLIALVLDVDDGTPLELGAGVWLDWEWALHTSYQHTPEKPRYRIIIPFAEPVSEEDYRRAHDWARARMAEAGAKVDPTSNEPSRLYFLPSVPSDRRGTEVSLHWTGTRRLSMHDVPRGAAPPAPAPQPPASTVDWVATDPLGAALSQDVDVDQMEDACAFLAHARDEADTLPEPEWRAALSLWIRCQDGFTVAHERSEPYEGYDEDETQAKIDTLKKVGPYTCEKIRKLSAACAGCPHQVTTPLALGRALPGEVVQGAGPTLSLADAEAWLAQAQVAEQQARGALEAARAQATRLRKHATTAAIQAHAVYVVQCEQYARGCKDATKAAERAVAKHHSNPVDGAPVGADPAVWARLLFDTRTGRPLGSKGNVRLVLEHDPVYAGRYRYNEFAQRIVYGNTLAEGHFDTDTATDLEYRYHLVAPTGYVLEVALMLAQQHRYHPVRDYLTSLKGTWSGADAISELFPQVFGTPVKGPADTKLYARFAAILLVSAVARVMNPGEKVDTMVILTGEQAEGKSSALRALVSPEGFAPPLGWFADSKLSNIGAKDTAMQIVGKWIYELSEMGGGFASADRRDRKQWLTSQEDTYRPPYGHHVIDVPRQVILVGTTNEKQFLSDPTGNRRYLVVPVGHIDVEKVKALRDQLWAQALHMYQTGYKYWVTRDEMLALADHNADYFEFDVWASAIADGLRKLKQAWVSDADVLVKILYRDAGTLRPEDTRRVRDVLRSLGCTQQRQTTGTRQMGWGVPEKLLRGAEDVITSSVPDKDNVLLFKGK